MIGLILASLFTFVELNCENLFDCRHDTLKDDVEFLPDGAYRWTRQRYWRKLDRIGQAIVGCGGSEEGWRLPSMVALCEVENDTVMFDLTRRSFLRKANYKYIMTDSPDPRGIDVALMYSEFDFSPINHRTVRVELGPGVKPTRDLLYVSGLLSGGDTLHVVVAHFPSRRGGEAKSRPYRQRAAEAVRALADSVYAVSPSANIIVAGDFNEYTGDANLSIIAGSVYKDAAESQTIQALPSPIDNRTLTINNFPSTINYPPSTLIDISEKAKGRNGAGGTYKYRGRWGSLDHIFASPALCGRLVDCYVFDASFLLCEDKKYGGVQPRRNYLGPRYQNGFSDHLPLVARFVF